MNLEQTCRMYVLEFQLIVEIYFTVLKMKEIFGKYIPFQNKTKFKQNEKST